MKVFVLNSGSSSQKSCLYDLSDRLPKDPPEPIWEGKVEWNGDRASLSIRDRDGHSYREDFVSRERGEATQRLLSSLTSGSARGVKQTSEVAAAGHRIVNGGADFAEPVRITSEVKAAIQKAAAFAPLHNRVELEGIRLIEQAFGDMPQVAVFDTGFHRRMPDSASIYPGPYEWVERGIRRYGFHGINHQYCAERAAQLLEKSLRDLRIVTCHLGNGCSLAAIRGGRSVDTTMGFTPLEGLMMGTRSGSVDPGILTFLMREEHLNGGDLDDLLNKKSGLLGVSGISSDVREIVSAMKEGQARAKLAFDIFVHRLRAAIGSMIASLAGIDVLVFTAGIGENSSDVRAATCANLGFVGVELDPGMNEKSRGDQDISSHRSAVRVLVLRAQEDWTIAKECAKLLRG